MLNFLYQSRVHERGRVFAQVKTVNLKPLPVKLTDKKRQDEIIKHVDLLLKLNQELKDTKHQKKIEQIKQHIEHSEEKINERVYKLYELTPEEIKIVENQ